MLQVIDNSVIREQLLGLTNSGCSLRDACERLMVSEEVARRVLEEVPRSLNLTAENEVRQLLDSKAPKVIQALLSIGLDETLDNVTARVSALKCLAELHRSTAEKDKENLDQFEETVNKMRKIVDNRLAKLAFGESRVNLIDLK